MRSGVGSIRGFQVAPQYVLAASTATGERRGFPFSVRRRIRACTPAAAVCTLGLELRGSGDSSGACTPAAAVCTLGVELRGSGDSSGACTPDAAVCTLGLELRGSGDSPGGSETLRSLPVKRAI
ncbi:hypothetical protein ACOMHN_039468 [Nucella lapillus]